MVYEKFATEPNEQHIKKLNQLITYSASSGSSANKSDLSYLNEPLIGKKSDTEVPKLKKMIFAAETHLRRQDELINLFPKVKKNTELNTEVTTSGYSKLAIS